MKTLTNVTFYTTGFLLNPPENISLLSFQAKDSIERSGNLYILYHFAIYLIYIGVLLIFLCL